MSTFLFTKQNAGFPRKMQWILHFPFSSFVLHRSSLTHQSNHHIHSFISILHILIHRSWIFLVCILFDCRSTFPINLQAIRDSAVDLSLPTAAHPSCHNLPLCSIALYNLVLSDWLNCSEHSLPTVSLLSHLERCVSSLSADTAVDISFVRA